jgi:presenilin-like A22 family membrane protease
MVSLCIITPVLFTQYLEPIRTIFPIVALTGIILIRRGIPSFIPTWIVFNAFSCYFMIYAGYSFGTQFSTKLLLAFLVGMTIYDMIGVSGGQMQSMATRMINYGVPIFVLVPHSRSFSFEEFRNIIKEDGLEALHESDHGISMLGIGDGFLPGALAVSAGGWGTTMELGLIEITPPQIGAAVGGIISLMILMWAELPRAIPALIMSVPGAIIGLGIGYGVDMILFTV